MYIWVILATFFVAIMAKTMTIREDYADLTVVPKAEAIAISFKILQDTAMKYARSHSNPSITYKSGCVGAAPCPNAMTSSDYPIGFKNPFGFESYIFCLDPANTGQLNATDCDNTTWNYAFTYGTIPTNWLDPVSSAPRYEFMKAIYNVTNSFNAGLVKDIGTDTTAANSNVIGTNFVIDTYMGYLLDRYGNPYMSGIPEIAIDTACGGFVGSPGIVCPSQVIYIEIINNPLGVGTPMPAPP